MTISVPVWFDTLRVEQVKVAADGKISFGYSDRWIGTAGTFPLSVSMPMRDEPYPSRIVSPWLANLLPEEGQLKSLARILGLAQVNVLDILEMIGGDTAGALSFGEPSDPDRWAYTRLKTFYRTDDAREALQRHFEDIGRRPFLAGEDGVRQSLAGGQKKSALAVLNPEGMPVLRLPGPADDLAIPKNGAPSTLIVKPDNPYLPGIVENEVWCLGMARAIGIDAAQATILRAAEHTAIGVLRFDRELGGKGRIRRLHQEDFAQANGVFPEQKYERAIPLGIDLKSILETVRHVGAKDALALLDQVIFNILVANSDAHAKNYSLFLPMAGVPRLAPLYDVSSVLSWSHVNQYHAQNIAGKKRKPGETAAPHWETVARDIGYRPSAVLERVRQLVDRMVAARVSVTEAVVAMPFASEGYVEQTAEAVERNALRIAGRL